MVAAAALLATALTGCMDLREWSYQADVRTVRTPVLAKRVVVPPLKDLRLHSNRNGSALCSLFIPLMPYGTAHYNKPELLPLWQWKGLTPCDPPRDVARAIAEELDNSGLFTQVVFSTNPEEGELVLNGDLITLKDDRWQTSYGLTFFFGNVLYLIGAPMGGTTHELTLKLTLVERDTGKTLWSETFSQRDPQTEWIYAMKQTLRHPQLLKTEMRQAINSLEAALSK